MTFKGHKYLKSRNLASCMSIPMFFGSGNPNMALILPYACSKVTLVTFGTLNMTFKGHKYLKSRNLASCMSISMFFGSRNPNMALKLTYARSKVTLVTFGTLNMTFKGHKYLKSRNLVSCMSISMFFGSRNPNTSLNCRMHTQRSPL
jgi:hypothetical protein